MRILKPVIWAGIPLLSLGAASLASALELKAALGVINSNVPNDTFLYDCNFRASNGSRAHIEAKATALDACGNTVSWGSGIVNAYSARVGTTGSTGAGGATGPCGFAVQHRAVLESHLHEPSTGEELYRFHLTGPNSGCWNSNTQTGACTSDTGGYWLNTAFSPTGACTARILRAASLGAP